MVKKYKSVLEKHNESLKPRRLPTPEEEAIAPVYPEEYLIGGPGKFAALGIRPSAKKIEDVFKEIKKRESQRIDPRLSPRNIKIGSRVEDLEANKALKEKYLKTHGRDMFKPTPEQEERLRKQAEKAVKTKAVDEIKKVTGRSLDRAQKNFFGEAGTHIGGAMADENRNAAGDTYKKGGEVKAKAPRRIDGCAIRGKTKGRMI